MTISETLKRILNKESETYRATLDLAMGEFAHFEVVLPMLPPLNDTEKRRAQLAIEQLNKDLDIIRNKLDQRKRDIYGVVNEAFNPEMIYTYHAHIAEYKDAMQLTKKRLKALFDGYHKATKAYDRCKNTLTQLLAEKERTESSSRTY